MVLLGALAARLHCGPKGHFAVIDHLFMWIGISGYDDIVEQVRRAWNNYRDQVGLAQEMCSLDWINLITY